MKLSIRGVHYQISEEDYSFLNKKLEKLAFCDNYLIHLDIIIKKESKGQGFTLDAKLHFAWKKVKIVSTSNYELYDCIDSLVDKIQSTAKKEKEKIQD